jgi:hypothetical protein
MYCIFVNQLMDMKKLRILLLLIAIGSCINSCTKPNTDQPCGTYGTNSQQVFKDGNGRCYYQDLNNGNKIYIDQCPCG